MYSDTVLARLSIQRALLGEISSNLRAVVFSKNDRYIEVRFYFDGMISDEDKESASCVETEIIADYDVDDIIIAKCIRVDMPKPIDDAGHWVYRRRE
ncbi:hypothetical protein [Candidatus Sororendozoicomonas aggregata]|uniref:hypothetical protein n=1 Tax=Candidatus Sororendozoicomonas aggregata TaxID=3073239 RepID=UPI002ED55E40